jgi:hypothetical protein
VKVSTLILSFGIAFAQGACSSPAPTVPVSMIPGHGGIGQDPNPKEGPRLVPPEVYIRTYIQLFGGLAPADVQIAARGADGSQLVDTWNDYLSSLGLPDYRVDIPRLTQTNTLMLATFERLGIALCNRSVERDLAATQPPMDKRIIFAFDNTAPMIDQAAFDQRFDVLHRTFLGYPLALGPKDRASGFFKLYTDTVVRHQMKGAPATRFKPEQAGWAEVCYGLVRHPEFHLY